ncbi:MAG TPA: hypothetical protein VFI73_08155 [Candidatus Nitrosopolaris sp.]|nr:hypothetical protein [Candidatus Nitrosopolaris sp.]
MQKPHIDIHQLGHSILSFQQYLARKFHRRLSLLFYKRIREDKIREIHGDLYLRNIFIINNKISRFYLYNRIESNDSLRYADIAEDVAHLSMDLDYYKRNDLRRYFISKYIEKSNDNNLQDLLYFLICYKACVRAKVSLFRAKAERIVEKRKA